MNEPRQVSIISDEAAQAVASTGLARSAVADAFVKVCRGEAELFPVAAGSGQIPGSAVATKSGRSAQDVGVKVGTYWPGNEAVWGIPNHGATTILLCPDTGLVSSVLNVSSLNCLRTAAADAVAVDTLARQDATSLAVIGTGHQALFDVQAILEVRPISNIRLWNRSSHRAQRFAAELAEVTDAELEVVDGSPDDASRPADIIVTATATTQPLLSAGGVKAGAHISAMGADSVGKQELSTDILRCPGVRCFADYPAQSIEIGELQHGVNEGLLSIDDITALGLVIDGRARGRTADSDITVFDSSGIAIQDIEVAHRVAEAAVRAGLDTKVPF
ncbi:MAG: ornithine cyclodeaminase family protein [Pseudomonadota bacterium]